MNQKLDSAIVKEAYPEYYQWASTAKTNSLLADIFDMLAQINANMIAISQHKPAKKVKPIPRPGKNKDEKKLGTPMPKDKLRDWIEEKRQKYLKSQGK